MQDTVVDIDGAPVDVHKMAADAGFTGALTLTKGVWEDCVAWNPNNEDSAGQSESGRLWDVLSAASSAHSEATQRGAVRWQFELLRVPRGGDEAAPVTLVWNMSEHDGAPMVVITTAMDD